MIIKNLSLSDVEWTTFKIKDIFEIELVKGKPISNYEEGKIPYVTTSGQNNGINNFVDTRENLSRKNSISLDPIAGKAFFHEYNFVGRGGAGSAINLLYNPNVNKHNALFICSSLERVSKEKASYGVQLNGNRLKNTNLFLPIDERGEPYWDFMKDYIELQQKNVAQEIIAYYCPQLKNKIQELPLLNDVEWVEFTFEKIFRKITRGKRLKKTDHIDGHTPYISSTSLNNGVDGFIGNEGGVRRFKNNITVANSGSVGSSFYHQYEYIASDHVTALELENADKYIYLFMSTLVNKLEKKYSFNYEINNCRINREKILLPIDSKGTPNWSYMKQYIKILEQRKILEITNYISNKYL